MSYNEAYGLQEGDMVGVKGTQEQHAVVSINGTLDNIFVLLDNGYDYRHDQLQKRNKA